MAEVPVVSVYRPLVETDDVAGLLDDTRRYIGAVLGERLVTTDRLPNPLEVTLAHRVVLDVPTAVAPWDSEAMLDAVQPTVDRAFATVLSGVPLAARERLDIRLNGGLVLNTDASRSLAAFTTTDTELVSEADAVFKALGRERDPHFAIKMLFCDIARLGRGHASLLTRGLREVVGRRSVSLVLGPLDYVLTTTSKTAAQRR